MATTINIAIDPITTTQALLELKPEWTALWMRCPAATPFQSPSWLLPWWRHLGAGELITLALRRAGQLIGLAPMYIHAAPGSPTRSVFLLGTGNTDYLDVLLEPGCEQEGMAAIFAYLHDQRSRWDICDFQQLQPSSPLLSATPPQRWIDESAPHDICPRLRLPPPGGDDSQAIPDRMRKKLDAYWRRAEREFHVSVEPANADNLASLITPLFRLHQARWAKHGEAGVLADIAVQRFHAEAMPALLAGGLLRLHALRLDDHIAAIYYGLFHRRRAYYYLSGFAPELGRLSPGSLVVHHAIREAAREQAQVFDFLRGREAYKYRWGAIDCGNRRRCLYYPSSPATRPDDERHHHT